MERPKQRRHRCKDPTKLDINSLTGEERVPVVHKGTGRRVRHTCFPSLLNKFSCEKSSNSPQYEAEKAGKTPNSDLTSTCPPSQLGGAMAPAIKELSRWLDANSEYYVAPDWADVVKHSVSIIHCDSVCRSLMTFSSRHKHQKL